MGRLAALVCLLLSPALAGCPGHEARVESALDALDRGRPAEAVHELNLELDVESREELPEDLGGDNPLLLLDRGTVLQSMDRYTLSQRDLGAADKAIEVLDLSKNAAHDLGRYLFSDDVGPYRAPAFEKLLVNTFNMMNYLARRDLNGARVEARRLAVMQRFLRDREDTTSLIGLGSYLAGFTFEKSGRSSEALRYYEEALAYQDYPSLTQPLRVLTRGKPKSPRVDQLVAGHSAEPLADDEAELVVIVGYGRVPRKLPTRIPIGLALTLVAADISPEDHALATELAAKGLVTWVNFPRLGKARGRYEIPAMWLDGRPEPLDHALDIEAEVRREWKESEPAVILSAITRLIARAAVGEIAHRSTAAASDNEAAGIIGLFAGLAATATLTILDTPDTRSWVTLPANVAIYRQRVRAGSHHVRVNARGMWKDYRLTLRRRGWAVLVATALR
jgi:hypothetical protein